MSDDEERKKSRDAMTCTLRTREAVSAVVLKVLQTETDQNWITETTYFENDLGIDGIARRVYYAPVARAITKAGCSVRSLTPDHFQAANTVKDIVTAVWASVKADL